MFGLGLGRAIRRVSPAAYRAVDTGLRYLATTRTAPAQEPALDREPATPAASDAAPVLESDADILARAEGILLRAISLGRQRRFKIAPEFVSISATENCNLECIMCPGHAGMKGPKLSLTQAEGLFASLAEKDVVFGRPKFLDMTSGEPTLNPQLHLIYRRFKELFPDAFISMISNATLPLRGRVREAFELVDRLGLSIDGATQETYERIRQGSKYNNVVRNIRDIAELKKPGVNCQSLMLMFVVMDQNIRELPELVRLAHDLGVPAVFAQVSEVRSWMPFRGNHNVSLTLAQPEIAKWVNEAKAEAERLGVELQLTSELDRAGAASERPSAAVAADMPARDVTPEEDFAAGIRTCHVPWFNAPRISQNASGIYPTTVCCHMPNDGRSGNLAIRDEFRGKTLNEIYNSQYYWDIRAGLLDGTLAKDACEGCQYYKMTQWSAGQLRELEQAVDSVEEASESTTRTAGSGNLVH